MTFDTSKPADNQKIRLGPQDIRDNFTAIQAGDSSFTPEKINLNKQGAAPTAIADVGLVFASEIGDGSYTELFYKNENDSLVQLTQDSTIGAETANFYGASIRLDTDASAVTFGVNNMIVAQGTINADGTLAAGSVNIASSSKAVSPDHLYTVNITADVLLNDNYRVMVTPFDVVNKVRSAVVVSKPTPVGGMVTAITLNIVAESTSQRQCQFDIIVIGGR
jgi:hypothetical protein